MKTGALPLVAAAPIVELYGDAAVAEPGADGRLDLQRARAFAQPLLSHQLLDTGENAWAHAEGVAAVLAAIGAAPSVQAAAYLVYAGDFLARPDDVLDKAFGPTYAGLVAATRKLVQAQRAARAAQLGPQQRQAQTERVRKMLLAFSRDLRVVLLRLASRLQTLRYFAAGRHPCPEVLAHEAQQIFAPLANRLGIWQIKWELEDLAFRFLRPEDYRRIAALLAEKRVEREQGMETVRQDLAQLLHGAGLVADVQGRPKHLYSIWKKMQGKGLAFSQVLDLRALRVICDDVSACYAALSRVHESWTPLPGQFDDYIVRPKPNGYQSLHTVVQAGDGRPVEVQIRTRQMHEHAEFGVAAHWAYKEAGVRGYAGAAAAGELAERVAAARKAVLRQLLAWERELAEPEPGAEGDERIYVFTPQATVIELPAGGTAVDFAYHLHSDLGHRCRGARVDGALLPLNTPLANGQTVEIVSAKDGGPSMDWLNPELGYLKSARSRAKVRAWFNAQAQGQTVARGRELVEKLLQRLGRTAIKLDTLAEQLGFRAADALFEVVGKDEYSLRHIEQLLRPAEPAADEADSPALQRSRSAGPGGSGVLVVGMDSLLTNLARCCRPAPPDPIGGFVTRERGVAIHRKACTNFRHMAARSPERVIAVTWGTPAGDKLALYVMELRVEASDRPGLLRDLTELLSKERINVTAVKNQLAGDGRGRVARLSLTVEAANAERLRSAIAQLGRMPGVRQARRA